MGNQLSYGDFLDNVTVEGVERAQDVVPEPSSVALITAGLADGWCCSASSPCADGLPDQQTMNVVEQRVTELELR